MSFIAAQNRYRPDIDGLRALAVTAVILYHAEIPGFPGGFVGVDVFFVISGYLITGILARSFSSGTFSLVEFYERRARRILPALFVVALAVLAAAPFLIHAWDLAPIGRNLKYVVTSVANLDFYKTLSNYSGEDASLTPMLHTWSLSVEEQFYLVIPLLWMLLCRFTRNPSHWLKLFAVAAMMSFVANLWMLSRDQSACFFLLPYRAWELAAGGMLALSPYPRLTPMTSRVAGLAGLVMILTAAFSFSHETPFPGPWALLPCLGAMLVILSGLGEKATLPQWILSSRPFVFVGLISYSLYLVHWPVLVFSRYQEQYSGSATTAWGKAGLLVLIFLVGWISWRFVESPFRRSGFWTRRRIFLFAWTGAATLFGLGYFYQKSPVFLKLLPEGARELAEARFSSNPLLKGDQSQEEVDNYYRYGSKEVEPDTVLWGDSHAAVLAYPLHELALSKNRSFLAYGRNSTPPIKGIICGTGLKPVSRAEYNQEVFDTLVSDKRIRNVILAARWAYYTEGNASAYGTAEKVSKLKDTLIRLPGDPPPGSDEVHAAFASALEETVGGLVEAGKTVYLVYPVPEPAYLIPQMLANEVIQGRDPGKYTISATGVYFERNAAVVKILDDLPQRDGLVRIRPEKLLIENGLIRLMDKGKPLYIDGNHLSIEGGRYIMPLFDELF